MSEDGVFPARSEEYEFAIQEISKFNRCDVSLVHEACDGVEPPFWLSKEHMKKVRDTILRLNRAKSAAQNLAYFLRALDNQEREDLFLSGQITSYQVENLEQALAQQVEHLDRFKESNPQPGGKNLDAEAIANIVVRLFRRLERGITWSHVSGEPTTDFGRSVEHALAVFGNTSNWRRPAENAYAEYKEEQSREALIAVQTNSKK